MEEIDRSNNILVDVDKFLPTWSFEKNLTDLIGDYPYEDYYRNITDNKPSVNFSKISLELFQELFLLLFCTFSGTDG